MCSRRIVLDALLRDVTAFVTEHTPASHSHLLQTYLPSVTVENLVLNKQSVQSKKDAREKAAEIVLALSLPRAKFVELSEKIFTLAVQVNKT